MQGWETYEKRLPTLNCTLLVQLRAQHSKSEEENGDREQDSDTEADSPDRRKVVLSGGRQYN